MKKLGFLLHPTAFPHRSDGIGTLGREAEKVINWFREIGFNLWQILPLNPPGPGGVPYSSVSAFALNPYLIDLELLQEERILNKEELENYYKKVLDSKKRVDYGKVEKEKFIVLEKVYENYINKVGLEELINFKNEHSFWLENYLEFMVLKEKFSFKPWYQWEDEYKFRRYKSLPSELEERKNFYLFLQFIVFKQWKRLRENLAEKGIKILGDIPIFVSYDSADVWANGRLFKLDESLNPIVIAGVPPDYFSKTGQLWGNPLYNWPEHQKDAYCWWKERFGQILKLVDYVRVDHFRGFEACWEVPYGEKTAINGQWVKTPGRELFLELEKEFGRPLPIVAEDLGVITEEVEKLRDEFHLPGMKIFQFCPWHNREELQKAPYFPPNYPPNCVAYTGTHDNQTLVGWLLERNDEERENLCWYLETEWEVEKVRRKILEKLYRSRAEWVIYPAQDLLGLDDSSRFNIPGTTDTKNWSWRLEFSLLDDSLQSELKKIFSEVKEVENENMA